MQFEEVYFSVEKLVINDAPLFYEERETQFTNLNKIDSRSGMDNRSNYATMQVERELILMKHLALSNKGQYYERMATYLPIDAASTGGNIYVFFVACYLLYLFIGQPSRDLNLALSYFKLNSRVAHASSDDDSDVVLEYEKHLGGLFFFKLFLYRRLPHTLAYLLGLREK